MKKLFAILFLITLLSCEKLAEERTYCWRCTMYSYWNSNKIINVSNYCNMTEQEIIAKEEYWYDLGFLYECEKR